MASLSVAATRLKHRSELLQAKQTAQQAKLAREEAKLIARPSAALQQHLGMLAGEHSPSSEHTGAFDHDQTSSSLQN